MENKKQDEKIIKRLDTIVALLIKLSEKEGKTYSDKDKIVMLDNFGYTPKEIADTIGQTSNYVSVQLSLYRKGNKPKKVKKK